MAISTKPINFRSQNLFNKKTYSSWLVEKTNNNFYKFKEAFEPLENSFGGDHIVAKNIFLEYVDILKNKFDKKWVCKALRSEKSEEEYFTTLLENGFEIDEAEKVIKESRKNAKRAATWSQHNITLGKKSSRFALLSLFTGIIKQWFFNNDSEIASSDSSNPPRSPRSAGGAGNDDFALSPRSLAFSIINSFFRSQRNLNQ